MMFVEMIEELIAGCSELVILVTVKKTQSLKS